MELSDTQLAARFVDVSLPTEELTKRLSEISQALVSAEVLQSEEQRRKLSHLCKDTLAAVQSDHEDVQVISLCCAFDLLRIFLPSPAFVATSFEILFKSFKKLAPLLRRSDTPKGVSYIYAMKRAAELCSIATVCRNAGLVGEVVEAWLGALEGEETGSEVMRIVEAMIVTVVEEMNPLADRVMYTMLISLTPFNRDRPRYQIIRKALSRISYRPVLAIDELLGRAFESSKGIKCEELRSAERYGIVYNLYKIQKDSTLRVLSLLPGEFESKDKTRVRKALELVGKLATCKGSGLGEMQQYLFDKFLEKFESPDKDIRILMMELSERFFKHCNPGTARVLAAAESRINDIHERVRILAIQTLAHASKSQPLPVSAINSLVDRLRDKHEDVRNEARCVLSQMYEEGSIEERLRGGEGRDGLDRLGAGLVGSFSLVQRARDQIHLVECLDKVVMGERTCEDAAKALHLLYSDLTPETRRDFSLLLQSKKYWMSKLLETISLKSDDLAAQEPLFSAHLQEPLSLLQMRAALEPKHSPIVLSILEDRNMSNVWIALANEKCPYGEKMRLREDLKDLARQKDTLTLRTVEDLLARVGTFWVSFDQISLLFSYETPSIPLLSSVISIHSSLITIILPNLMSLLTPGALPEIWSLLRTASKERKLKASDIARIQSIIPVFLTCEHESTMREMGVFLGESMPDDYLRSEIMPKIVPKLKEIDPASPALLSYLTLIQELLSAQPEAILGSQDVLIPYIAADLLTAKTVITGKKDQSITSLVGKCKVVGTAIMALYARNQKGFSAAFNEKRVFGVMFKLTFRLGKYVKKRAMEGNSVSIALCFSKLEEQKVRAKALGELLSLLILKEVRSLLTPRKLVCLALLLFSSDSILASKLVKFLTSDSDVRSRVLPHAACLLSILSAAFPKHSSIARSSLSDIMTELSSLPASPDAPRLEVYIIYVVAVCASHPVFSDPALTKRCLTEYLQAIPPPINNVYLLSLCHLLPKFELKDVKPIVVDIPLPPSKASDLVLPLSDISDLLSDVVRELNPSEDLEKRDRKVMIPGHFFRMKEGMDSAKKYIESSAVSKRSRDADSLCLAKRLSLRSEDA